MNAHSIGRRRAIELFGGAFAALAVLPESLAQSLEASARELSLAEFLAVANPLAKSLVQDHSRLGQDLYLLSLAALATRLRDVAVPEMREQSPGHFIGANEGGDPFVILHWRLAPGAVIKYHPHRYGHVCTVGLEGDGWVRNFELLEASAYQSKESFLVRRTQEVWLAPGRINTMSLERDFIHGFVAGPQGMRGLDITTRIKPRVETPALEIEEQDAEDLERGLYRARWVEGS